VLAPRGLAPTGPGIVTVSLTGYAGFESGLDQAVAGYPGAEPEEFRRTPADLQIRPPM
jgi:hypothetical protein